MSEFIDVRTVHSVEKHPNADSLVMLRLGGEGGFIVVHTTKEPVRTGQQVLHFPTDICIDPNKAVELGVAQYLKSAQYKDQGKCPCRIAAARLRGVPSHGFVKVDIPEVTDFDEYYGVFKYEPPEPVGSNGDILCMEHRYFPQYTKIKRIQYNPDIWVEGMLVRITEKLHGTNARFGLVPDDAGGMIKMCGSHHRILKQYDNQNRPNKYWAAFTPNVEAMLLELSQGNKPVVAYGEIFGPGIQDLDYGLTAPALRIFDIAVEGQYLNWLDVKTACLKHQVELVPLLYDGPFRWGILEGMTHGDTVVSHPSLVKSTFRGREGVVVTPLVETITNRGERMIAKSISVDYEQRRNARESH